jgi:hypothetical protein
MVRSKSGQNTVIGSDTLASFERIAFTNTAIEQRDLSRICRGYGYLSMQVAVAGRLSSEPLSPLLGCFWGRLSPAPGHIPVSTRAMAPPPQPQIQSGAVPWR